MLRNLICRRALWSIRVFRARSAADVLDLSLDQCQLVHVVDQPLLRFGEDFASTIADPFLFSHGGALYLFYEVQTDFEHGAIHAQAMDTAGNWTDLGCVLREPFHMSFPNVFTVGEEIYMLPETTAAGKVLLYKATGFPTQWAPVQVLTDVPLLDPILLPTDSHFVLLGTTMEYELLAFASDTLASRFRQYGPAITCDRSLSRNGGPPLRIGSQWYRVSQNCEYRYGTDIGLSLITEMTQASYSETVSRRTLLSRQEDWMDDGYHGLTLADFEGAAYFALDGRRKDLLVNNYILSWLKLKAYTGRLLAQAPQTQSEPR